MEMVIAIGVQVSVEIISHFLGIVYDRFFLFLSGTGSGA